MSGYKLVCIAFVVIFKTCFIEGQVPPRLNIPGAVLISRPPQRGQRPQPLSDAAPFPPIRPRKPIPNALPVSIPIREEIEDTRDDSPISDDDSAKLSLPAFQAVTPHAQQSDPEPNPRPIQFRPERPIPILRQDVRESSGPPRPVLRQNTDEDDDRIPIRQAIPQARRVVPQPTRNTIKPQPRPPASEYPHDDDNRRNKNRKPPVQILRKYRTDNEDGSITWGFENEDGTFKEETIGTDCIIKGKYGYIDPEGTKRAYSYEAGNKCDHREEELPPEAPGPENIPNQPTANSRKALLRAGPLQN